MTVLIALLLSLVPALVFAEASSPSLGIIRSLSPLDNAVPTNTTPNSFFQCNPNSKWTASGSFPLSNCMIALRSFPPIYAAGRFHQGGATDLYRLPAIFPYEKCSISVDLADPSRLDESTWPVIRQTVIELALACEASRGETIFTVGGWMTAGDGNGIKVTVSKQRATGDENANATATGDLAE